MSLDDEALSLLPELDNAMLDDFLLHHVPLDADVSDL